jgi:hypothetical protein
MTVTGEMQSLSSGFNGNVFSCAARSGGRAATVGAGDDGGEARRPAEPGAPAQQARRRPRPRPVRPDGAPPGRDQGPLRRDRHARRVRLHGRRVRGRGRAHAAAPRGRRRPRGGRGVAARHGRRRQRQDKAGRDAAAGGRDHGARDHRAASVQQGRGVGSCIVSVVRCLVVFVVHIVRLVSYIFKDTCFPLLFQRTLRM